MLSDEANVSASGAMRFDSHENPDPSVRPRLTVDFSFASPSWAVDQNGNWSDSSKWSGNVVPSGAGAAAQLGGAIHADHTITLDTPRTIGTLLFDQSSSRYTITGATLTLDTPAGGATPLISVFSGNHTISAPVQLAKNTTVAVVGSATGLAISGTLSASPGVTLTKAGGGSLQVTRVCAAGLTINDGTVAMMSDPSTSGTSSVQSLNIAGNATCQRCVCSLYLSHPVP